MSNVQRNFFDVELHKSWNISVKSNVFQQADISAIHAIKH